MDFTLKKHAFFSFFPQLLHKKNMNFTLKKHEFFSFFSQLLHKES
jgi:hypothetical protein